MEWLSAKKWLPAPNVEVFIITQNGSGYLGWYDYKRKTWKYDAGVHADHDNALDDVTHFCIPERIEEEE